MFDNVIIILVCSYCVLALVSLSMLPMIAFILPVVFTNSSINKKRRVSWQHFAALNNLSFLSTVFPKGVSRIIGDHNGYSVSFVFRRAKTYITVSTNRQNSNFPNNEVLIENATNLFGKRNLSHKLKGRITVEKNGQILCYEQLTVEQDSEYLQYVLELLCNLANAYQFLFRQGAQVIPYLQISITNSFSGLQPIIHQLIQDISRETTVQLSHRISCIWCSDCMVRYTTHRVQPLLYSITYYGCRVCHQSQEFFEWQGKVVAVIDTQMIAKYSKQDEVLQLNWLAHNEVFDFDEVYINHATDYDIERFAVQIGNDTDKVRIPRYGQMRCTISEHCKLSENTMRILHHTFGQIKMGEGWKQIARETNKVLPKTQEHTPQYQYTLTLSVTLSVTLNSFSRIIDTF